MKKKTSGSSKSCSAMAVSLYTSCIYEPL